MQRRFNVVGLWKLMQTGSFDEFEVYFGVCWVFTASYLQAGDASLSKGDFTIALRQYSTFIGKFP